MTRIATVEDPLALPGPLPLQQPTDLKTDEFGRLIVLATIGPPTSEPTVLASILAASGVVSLKASPGVLFRAQLAAEVPFAGQLYFQLFDKAAAGVAPGDVADWSTPIRLADLPIGVFMMPSIGTEFATEISAAFSLEPFEFKNAGLDAKVSAIIA